MKIAVIGPPGEIVDALCLQLQGSLPRSGTRRYDLPDLQRDRLQEGTAAAFVLVDDMHGVLTLQTLVQLYPRLPVAIVSASPDFALTGIRLGTRDYLIRPVLDQDLQRAIGRLFVREERGENIVHLDSG